VLAVLSSFAGPDNALYPMKRFGESTLVTLEVDPVNRAGLEVKLAQTREREAEDMAGRGNGDGAVAALATRYELLRTASRDLIGVPTRDARWKSVRGRLFTESDHPITQIQRDLQVSGQKRSSEEVQQLIAAYENDRKPLESDLGRPPPQTGTPPPTG
jgi:hypothetical protein